MRPSTPSPRDSADPSSPIFEARKWMAQSSAA